MLKGIIESFLEGCAYEIGQYCMHTIFVEHERKKKEEAKKKSKKNCSIGFKLNEVA